MLMTANVASNHATSCTWKPFVSWNIPTDMRSSPYPPIFNSTPASMMLTAVGASVWASGSQLWNGHSGILTANAVNRKNQITPAGINRSFPAIRSGMPWIPSDGIDTMANVSTPEDRNSASMPISMNALPPSVKITNFIAE